MNRTRLGAAVFAPALLLTLLVGCGSGGGSDEPSGDPASSESSSAAEDSSGGSSEEASDSADSGNRVSGDGVSFEKPEGWITLEADDLTQQAEGNSDVAEAARQMNLSPEELTQAMGQASLFLIDPEGGNGTFADNINVLAPGGTKPPDSVIEQQFSQLGATVQDLRTEDSDLGEVTVVSYVLPVAAGKVQGVSLIMEPQGQTVNVTVSTTDRDTSTELADGILGSLQADDSGQ